MAYPHNAVEDPLPRVWKLGQSVLRGQGVSDYAAPCRSPVYIAQGARHAWFCLTLNSGSFKEHHPQIQNGHVWYFCWDRFREKWYQMSTKIWENAQAGKVRGTIPSDYETPYQVRREWLGDFLATWSSEKRTPWLFRVYKDIEGMKSYPVMWRWFPKTLQGSLFSQPGFNGKYPAGFFCRGSPGAGYMFNNKSMEASSAHGSRNSSEWRRHHTFDVVSISNERWTNTLKKSEVRLVMVQKSQTTTWDV